MGVTYFDFEIKKTSVAELQDCFKQKVSQARRLGSYRGGWDRVDGLNGLQIVDKTFDSRSEAVDYVKNNAEKHGQALAVTYIAQESLGVIKKGKEVLMWYVGCWASS